MHLWNRILGLWAFLSLVSLAIDGACVWIDMHSSAQLLLEPYHVNYLTVFVWSVSAPFVLALLLPTIGAVLMLLCRILSVTAQGVHVLVHHGQPHGHGLR